MFAMSLGVHGQRYLEEFLEGESGMCVALSMCPLDTGSYSAFVPDGVAIDRAARLKSGGIFVGKGGGDLFGKFSEYLRESISASGAGYLIVQDPWAEESDMRPRTEDERMLYCAGLGVCHISLLHMFNQDELRFLISDIVGTKYIAALISQELALKKNIMEDKKQFSDNVVGIFGPVYDGESILIWEKELTQKGGPPALPGRQ